MRAVRARLQAFAAVPWAVRIEGPTGSGKGLAAEYLHRVSRRADGPFVRQSVTLLLRGLELAHLVGWTRGAFTGAVADHPGVFERAHGGTLFLDEIACANGDVQAALLQLVEDGEVERFGETRPRRVDVRLVFATNADLEGEVARERFRHDLYPRLGSLVVRMPALKDHAEDIPEIAAVVLARRAAEAGVAVPRLSAGDMGRLQAYHWPANVRELDNALRFLLVAGELPEPLGRAPTDWRAQLDETLGRHGGNKTAAARRLGVSVRTVHRALARSDSR
jgi:DNA-binding NtrC family response regulator